MSFSEESVDSMPDMVREEDVPGSPTFTVTDLLTSLGEKNQDPEYLVTKGNNLVILLQQYPYIKEDLVLSSFGHRLQTLLTHPKKEVVATGYRICRYVIYDVSSIQALISLKLDILIIISLSKGPSHDIEREQALKLVRKFIETLGGKWELTRGIANALLAVAEQIDERLRKICIETVCEICLLRPDLVSPQALIQFTIDGPYELSSICATVILTLLNEPEGRKYIVKADMLRLISPFTEFPVKGHLNNEKLQMNAYIITRFMKNLAGFHGLCMGDNEPLKNLIQCLSFPVQGVVSKLLDVFLDVLMIYPMSKKTATGHSNKMILVPLKLENAFVLHSHYLSLIVLTLLRCNITGQLLDLLTTTSDEGTRTKTGFLLTELASMAWNLVPDELLATLEGGLFKLESQLSPFGLGSRSEFMIEKLSRKSNKGRTLLGLESLKINDNFLQNSQINHSKLKSKVDDASLKQMIQDTRVLSTKNFADWKCDVISELFTGPLTNGRRLEEVNRTTKFLKRLLSFYRPFKHKFSGTKSNKKSLRFIKVGCDILECLLSTQEGIRIIKESKVFPQIAECLAQLDPYSGLYAKDQIFSKERLESTLTSGYFKMLGVLSSMEQGLELMRQWKVFSIMHHIADHPFKRDDLILLFMNEMDYKKSGQLRVLLSKFLHSENIIIKRRATDILSRLIEEPQCNAFVCEAVIEQLYEQDQGVAGLAIKILSDYCNVSQSNLDQIIQLAPSINMLRRGGDVGERLLMKFLTTSTGFEYLQTQGFIDEEFDNWISGERYITYAVDIESELMNLDKDFERDQISKKTVLPVHFFGDLVKTEEGFNVIVHSGIMTELVNIIRYYATSLEKPEGDDDMDYLKLNACMWAIGMISTSELGIETLDVNGCIEDLVQIATASPLINLRGSAFYVLGLISKTSQGIEILDEFGWSTKLDVFNQSIGITLPRELTHLVGWSNENDINPELEIMEYSPLGEIDHTDVILEKLIRIVGFYCNHIYSQHTGPKELATLLKQHPEYFEDPDVFFLVLRYFELYKYRLPVRKMIIEAFTSNGKMLDVLVKRDKRRIKELLGH